MYKFPVDFYERIKDIMTLIINDLDHKLLGKILHLIN